MNVGDIIKLLGEGWDLIGKLLKNRKLEDAGRVLDAIELVWETVKSASDRKITLTTAQHELRVLMDEIEANDAAADDAIDKKFPSGED